MKSNIHPVWYPEAKITCSCGSSFTAGSSVEEIRVEICSQCHPFFTGQMKFVDTAGRVERFQQKQKASKGKLISKKEKRHLKRLEAEKEEAARPKSLKEMLQKKGLRE